MKNQPASSLIKAAAVLLLTHLLFFAGGLLAQTDPAVEQGIKAFGSYQGGDLDSVNTTTGKLIVHIPLWSYPQLGGRLKLDYLLAYDSPSMTLLCNPNCQYTQDIPQNNQPPTRTVSVTPDLMPGAAGKDQFQGQNYLGTLWTVTEQNGAVHMMGAVQNGSSPLVRAVDGSAYMADLSNWTYPVVIDSNGNRYASSAGAATATDLNGNQITLAPTGGIQDTIGRTIPPLPTFSGQGGNGIGCSSGYSKEVDWVIPSQQSTTVTLKFCYDTAGRLMNIVLPNQTAYTFTYETPTLDYPGFVTELSQITLPAGGSISYTYGTKLSQCDGTGTKFYRSVATRTVDEGSGPHTWSYSFQGWSPITATITDPLNNVAVHTSSMLGSSTVCSPYETEYQQKDSSGNVLKTVDTAYSWTTGGTYEQGYALSVVPSSVTTTWPNNQKKQTSTSYGPTFSWYALVTSTGGVGYGPYTAFYSANPYTVSESDYGSGSPGGTLRTTSYVYTALPNPSSSCNSSNYCLKNLLNIKQSAQVTGAGNSSSTTYNYDENSSTIAGNLTSIHRSLNLPPKDVVSSMTYTNYGMVAKSLDPLQNPTTYTYDATNLFLQQVKDAAGHITYFTYDANTGELVNSTDPNNAETQYVYDAMKRVTSITYPSGGGSATYTYGDTPGSLSVELQHSIDGTYSTNEFALFDGLGREISLSKANGEASAPPWDKTDICYDARGLKSFVSYPYQASSYSAGQVCSGPGDGYTYDALTRVTQVTHSDSSTVTTAYSGPATSVSDEGNGTRAVQKISQVDGLGRLTSLCEMSATNQPHGTTPSPTSPCNSFFTGAGFPTTHQYDVLGNLTSVAQAGLNSRGFSYDSLSRLLTATNPESGTTCYGTWTSGYGSTCSSGYDDDGNMTKRTMLAPNQASNGTGVVTTTYGYDVLNHLNSKTYSDGVTPGSYYYYDQTAAFGQSLTNGLGRLTSEGVYNGSAWVNSAEFSYDLMGRVIFNGQGVPTQYNLNYGYDFISDVTSMANGAGVTFTPTYNIAGRPISVGSSWWDSSHPASLVSSISYSPWGTAVAATFGNGVSETRQYYPRGWLNTVTETGMVYSAGTAGSGSITVSGAEKSNAQGSGVVTITGSEQNKLSQPATQSTGTLQLTGTEHCTSTGNSPCHWDTGTVDIAVNGYHKSTLYGQNSTTTTLASALATLFHNDSNSPVDATSSSSKINFTSRATGSNTNYQIVGTVTSDTSDFSFLASPVNMTGGKDAVYTYDAGTVYLIVGTYHASASFDNTNNNTAAKVATALAASLNLSTIVTATASNANVTITSTTYGASTNYTLTPSNSSSQGFVPPSFGFSSPPSSLSGGKDPAGSSHVYDTGTASVTVNGHQAQVSYRQSSTPTSIASAVASAINNNCPDVTANANGTTTITITAKSTGSSTNYSVSESLTSGNGFSPPSFSLSSLAALSGGTDPNTSPGTIYGLSLGYAANGDVTGASDTANGNWTYAYDDMNRLLTSTCGSGCTGSYSYEYDRFGNRWLQKVTSGTGLTVNYSFDANNRISAGVTYDPPGNMTFDGVNYYTYDAENRLVAAGTSPGSSNIASYVYDVEGRRNSKTTGAQTLNYLYDLAGHQLAELTSSGTVNRQEIYAGGSHLGTYAAGTTYFHHADWLGTERVRSAMTAQACETIASLPFGDGQTTSGSCGDPSPLHFTAKQRDLESGLDYFGARYNASSMGRFMSPDPVAGSISDPQSLNAYVYLHNSPLNGTDPTGAIVEWSDSGKTQKGGEAHPRTSAQRAFENRLRQMRESKDPKTRERGERLTHTYERLQASKATFEVTNEHGSEESKGEITYQGNDHFTVSLAGDPALFLSDNQRLAHEFEHGRQVLDGEYSFIHTPTGWKPFAHDRTDEAEGFQAGFDMERAQPGQGSVANNIQRQLDMGGISAGADFLRGVGDYNTLPKGPVNVEYSTPSIYKVPQ